MSPANTIVNTLSARLSDPLDMLLRRAVQHTQDQVVRNWLRALERGETATEAEGRSSTPPAKPTKRHKRSTVIAVYPD